MVTNEESVCCKEVRMGQNHLAGAVCNLYEVFFKIQVAGLECICNHPLVTSILDKQILTIQLLVLWDATRSSAEIENK